MSPLPQLSINRAISYFSCGLALLLCFSTSDVESAAKPTAAKEIAMSNENVKSDNIAGVWQGSLDIGNGMALPLVFKFVKTPDGKLSGSMQSPAQSQMFIDFDKATCDTAGSVMAEIEKIKGRFDGKFSGQNDLSGTWTQGGVGHPLKLSRTDEYKPPRRPQEPSKPYPYVEKEVSFDSGANKIAGTLTLPAASGKFPAAILICGSGPHDRDEQIFFHKPFLIIADYLTRHNIAVLRYDKRGVGKSKGDYASATTMDFADDAQAALKFLETQENIDSKNIGLIGHSEGGVIAPIVASRCPGEVKFIVSLAGSALPGDKILLSQIEAMGKSAGLAKAQLEAGLELSRKSYAIVESEPDNNKALEKLRVLNLDDAAHKATAEALTGAADSSPEKKNKSAQSADEELLLKLKVLTSPWYRFFISFDPRSVWSKVKCPVLALNGEKDLQVIAAENLGAMSKSMSEGGNSQLTTDTIPGVNHLFQTCKTGLPSEYASIEETVAPTVLSQTANWIEQQVSTGRSK